MNGERSGWPAGHDHPEDGADGRRVEVDIGHSHGHGHGLEGGWSQWRDVPALRVTLVGVALAALVTLVGVVTVWPDGSGRAAIQAGASDIGLLTDPLDATVNQVSDGDCSYSTPDNPQTCRLVVVTLEDGPEAGSIVALPEANLSGVEQIPDLKPRERIVVSYEPTTNYYFYADRDRGSSLVWLCLLFAVVVVALGRIRGLFALAAMGLSVLVLVGFVAPSVIDGHDPLTVSVIAAALIAFISLYLTHGFNPTTTVALAGTLAALGLTLGVSWLFFGIARFSGLATEAGLLLPLISEIDVVTLLLGGAVLGALGALDDVTVTQVATVAELHHRNPRLTATELFTSGIRVGREHIGSAVNTLLLAYAGASMPLLLLFAASDQSLLSVANSEVVAVEIVRTLCGSIGLVAAVPLTTILAAILVANRPVDTEPADHDHDHDVFRHRSLDEGTDHRYGSGLDRSDPIRTGPPPAPDGIPDGPPVPTQVQGDAVPTAPPTTPGPATSPAPGGDRTEAPGPGTPGPEVVRGTRPRPSAPPPSWDDFAPPEDTPRW